jgi:pyrimidine-specific ribonucleoside hydrolase
VASGTGEPVPVVLDVDTGVDDACALLLAARHPALELRAVTCVAGNTEVDQVVTNTLTVLSTVEREDVPVARGADRPLLEPVRAARHAHGDDGMGDLGMAAPARDPDPRQAVELLRDVLLDAAQSRSPVTLLPLGPLTNIALLLRAFPEAAAGLREIVFMGGSGARGNVTAAAEFNVWHDPEAAAVVLDAAITLGVPVTMYGLDVFYRPRVSRDQALDLAVHGGPAARLGAALIGFQCERFGAEDATIGDAGAVCAVIEPDGLATARLPVRVELSGTWTRGQTVVDRRDWAGDLQHDPRGVPPATVDVALDVDAARYTALWLQTLLT